MDASVVDTATLLAPGRRLHAPIFQRRYVWSEDDHLAPFWADVSRYASGRLAGVTPEAAHFMGAVLIQALPAAPAASQAPSARIIDGQQRLITLTLALAAVRHIAAAASLDDFSTRARRHLLVGAASLVTAADADAETVSAAIETGDPQALAARAPGTGRLAPDEGSTCVGAYQTLHRRIAGFVEGIDARPATDGHILDASRYQRLGAVLDALLLDLRFVLIALDAEEDGPAIFEALNHRRARLTSADLVKNDVVRRARIGGEDARALIDRSWSPLADAPFWRQEERMGRSILPRMDNLLRHHLTALGAGVVPQDKTFERYAAWMRGGRRRRYPSVAAELDALATAADAYRRIVTAAPDAPPEDMLQAVAARLKDWGLAAMLAPMIAVSRRTDAPEAERSSVLDAIVGLVVRRAATHASDRNFHRGAARLAQAIAEAPAALFARAVLAHMSEQRSQDLGWPTDHAFGRSWTEAPLLNREGARRTRRLLVEIEAAESGVPAWKIAASAPELDHIMPRNWARNRDAWPVHGDQTHLARTHAARQAVLDVIGNLALVEPALHNDLGDRGFQARQPVYARSRYATTRQLAAFDPTWDETTILARGDALFRQARAVWPGPDVGYGGGARV